MVGIEDLKAEFRRVASADPAYYYNPKWRNLLNLYMSMAYALGYEDRIKVTMPNTSKPVAALDQFGNPYKRFPSIRAAADYVKTDPSNLGTAIKRGWKCKGFNWCYL